MRVMNPVPIGLHPLGELHFVYSTSACLERIHFS